jgi:hypothetical protein
MNENEIRKKMNEKKDNLERERTKFLNEALVFSKQCKDFKKSRSASCMRAFN